MVITVFLKVLNSSLFLVVSYIMKPFQILSYMNKKKNVIFLSVSTFPEDNDQVKICSLLYI